MLGTNGYSQLADEKYTLSILDNVLGGSMSSRLFQEIREKRGLAYSVGSYTQNFREGGYFAVYAGTSADTAAQVIDLVRTEFKNVRETTSRTRNWTGPRTSSGAASSWARKA